MWFKRVLLGSCVASLAVTIVTAVSSNDATVSKRYHEVYRLTFSSLERRQQPARNQTSSIDVSNSKDATSFSRSTSTEMSLPLVTSVESGSFIVSVPISSTFITVSLSEMVSTSVLKSQPSAKAATSIEQDSRSLSSSSFGETTVPISTPAISVATSSAQAQLPSSIIAVTVSEGHTSMPSVARASSSAAPELTTAAVPDSTGLSSIIQTPTLSDRTSSEPVPSAFESESTSVLDFTTSTIEETRPAPSSSFLAVSAVTTGFMEQALSGIFVGPTTTGLHVPSSITDRPSEITSSSPILIPASSAQTEQDPTIGKELGFSTSVFDSQTPPVSSDLTTGEPSSRFPAPTTSSSPIMAQLPQFSSETGKFTSSSVEVVTPVSISLSFTSSTFAPSPTFVQTGPSVSTSSEAVTTSFASAVVLPSASVGTGFFSSINTGGEYFSLLLPSETLVGSAFYSMVSSSDVSHTLYPTATFSDKQPGVSGSSPAFSTQGQSLSGVITASKQQDTSSQASSVLSLPITGSSLSSTSSGSSVSTSSLSGLSQASPLRHPTSVAAPSVTSSTNGAIPTSETDGSSFATMTIPSSHTSVSVATFNNISSFASLGTLTSRSSIEASPPLFVQPNATQTRSSLLTASGMITATFSTAYISSARSSVLDLSTFTFSSLNSATVAAANQTDIRTSSATATMTTPKGSGKHVLASESHVSSTIVGHEANSTWKSPLQPSWTATAGPSGSLNTTRTSIADLGITYSRSMLLTGTTIAPTTISNATQAETLHTSSEPVAVNSTTAGLFASITSASTSGLHLLIQSSKPASSASEALTMDSSGAEDAKTSAAPHTPTSSSSQTATAAGPTPLTTSQTAGVAVGATTGLLIAVVAAIFIARRYYAAEHGKRMSTGSIYPEIAYLYDPRTGRYGGDAEALMTSTTDRPNNPASRAAKGFSGHMQHRSTGTMPAVRFTSPGNPFTEAVRDPAIQRYSEYARIDTTRALSAAVAGYNDATKHTSSYTKYPSEVTNPFSDHVIPSPTFAPFSPDDIRRPEIKAPHNRINGRGEYSQMSVNPYAYLNTPASMYPPVSSYGPSLAYNTRRQTIDSDPFADPFEHDLLLHVDEQNRTSDSMTIFAPSPNLMPPRTPRTPVGPKLPIRQPNGMMSARSLLSPVVAKYLHQAQEVKILQKSVASPVLVQVGRSPVIQPFSPPPAAPEPLGWDDIKRNSEKHYPDEQSVPAPLKFASSVIKKKPVPISHTRTKPSLTGAGQALLAGKGLPLTVKIPHRYSKSVGLDVPRMHARPDPAHERLCSDPVVREKRSRELRFADPALIGKDF